MASDETGSVKYFLGVDGGQSSTTALIADRAGRVLGMGRAGPCNHTGTAEGRQKFVSAVTDCLASAARSAGLANVPRFTSACLGFSGGPVQKDALVHQLLTSERTIVTDDALIALSGATVGRPGIMVIAGTGSIAFGRNEAGKTARAGGWGYIFGDEGSGFDIARQALRAALSLEEGWGPATSLRAVLLEATGAADANDLLHRFYTAEFSKPQIAALSKLVDQAAAGGDAVAREILSKAGRSLAELVRAVRPRLFPAEQDVQICYIGGVFRSHMVRQHFYASVESDAANHVGPPAYGPAAGALLEAYRAAGISTALSKVPEEKP